MKEVAVLYGDLALVRVSWNEKKKLRRDNVIAISVVDPNRTRKDLRHQALIENDYYILVWTDKDCCLFGHNGDDAFFSLDDPNAEISWRFPFLLPENSIVFDSVYITAEAYAKARGIFLDRDGGMY